jgi:drug/metabolite transporter (DMT)-like permease
MLAIALALGSSIMWGTADFCGGAVTRRLPVLSVTLVSQAAGLVALLIVFAARGAHFDSGSLGEGLLSGVGGAIGLACFYQALALGTMSIVSPLAACGAVVSLALSLAGGERPSAAALGGVVLALAGAVMAAAEEGRAGEGAARRRAVILAVLAAVTLGGFIYFLGLAARHGDSLSALLSARIGSLSLLAAAAALRRPPLHGPPRQWWAVAGIGLLDVGANTLFALATTRGLLAVVSVLGSLYPVTTVLLAHVVLGERLSTVQRLGVTAALIGVAIVSAS